MVDLERAQYPTPRVSKVIDVPLNTLRGWKYGSEPAHNYGLVLLELWCEVTGRELKARPMVED